MLRFHLLQLFPEAMTFSHLQQNISFSLLQIKVFRFLLKVRAQMWHRVLI